MSTSEYQVRSPWRPGRILALTLVIVAGLVAFLWWRVRPKSVSNDNALIVYCAVGLRLPVEEAAAAFTKETGIASAKKIPDVLQKFANVPSLTRNRRK